MSMYVAKHRPAKSSCIFYSSQKKWDDGPPYCRLTTYQVCDPSTCPWYKNEEMTAESFEKARRNYIKNHGRDDYYKLGYGPKRWSGVRFKNIDNDEEEAKSDEGKD